MIFTTNMKALPYNFYNQEIDLMSLKQVIEIFDFAQIAYSVDREELP